MIIIGGAPNPIATMPSTPWSSPPEPAIVGSVRKTLATARDHPDGDPCCSHRAGGVAVRPRRLRRRVARVLGPAARGARRPARARGVARGVEHRDGVLPGGAAGGLRPRAPAGAPRLAGRAARGPRGAVGRCRPRGPGRGAAPARGGTGRPPARAVAPRHPGRRARGRLRRRLLPHPARPGVARAGGDRGRVHRSVLPLLGLERGLGRRPARLPVPHRALRRAGRSGLGVERRPARARPPAADPVARATPRSRYGSGCGRAIPEPRRCPSGGPHPRAGRGPERAAARHHALPHHRRGLGAAAVDRAAGALPRHLRPRLRAPPGGPAADPRAPRGPRP